MESPRGAELFNHERLPAVTEPAVSRGEVSDRKPLPAIAAPDSSTRDNSNQVALPKIPAPAQVNVTLEWVYPTNFETRDLVFKVYHTTDLALPASQWNLLTNVSGTVRTASFSATNLQEFYVLTASNYLGESGFATP